MPAQYRLGLDPQGRPGRSREAIAKGSQHHPIGRRPSHPRDLALEHLDLAPKRQHLSLELGLVALAGGERVQQDSQEGVQRRSDHGQR
jgi:hypothetical protein